MMIPCKFRSHEGCAAPHVEMPQMPWPLRQPLPNAEPAPTSAPSTTALASCRQQHEGMFRFKHRGKRYSNSLMVGTEWDLPSF